MNAQTSEVQTAVQTNVTITIGVPGSDMTTELDVPQGTTLRQIMNLLQAGNPEIKGIDVRLVYNNRAPQDAELDEIQVEEGATVSVARKVSNG